MTTNDWSIQEIARTAGTTSRTLRHYDDVGLLRPSRTGTNGYRYYDAPALVRLQRILLLRDLGLGLPAIAEALDSERDEVRALGAHLAWLRDEQERVARQVVAVQATITALEKGTSPMAHSMFDGFDHTRYAGEVQERWGAETSERSTRWWSSLSASEKEAFLQTQHDIGTDFGRACAAGLAADSAEVQALARRQVAWLAVSAEATTGAPLTKEYVVGLAHLYADDPRFAATYDRNGTGTALLVRDAMIVLAETEL
ncbi:MerR family transcriptional regulator [Sanguibacter antarcticus]|uniref:DNA-binding transcriptional MerR regulator n=1 Tax=Sanguibacter antarcticus TaxID=372484 RepID=A0A2A9E844_9MICO|nr:MerR family transcriptional regulator [Sanguibacter antarcticus]PFG35013.1 DNA-binding transcriptional MerR regulator [Sanguibacter antarcticus]